MKETTFWQRKVILPLTLSVLALSTYGCGKSPESLPTPPISLQAGKAGEAPTEVFQSYDWIIVSQERYKK